MEVMCCTRGVIHCNNYLIYMLFKMMVWEKENQIADKDNYFSNLKIIIAFHFFFNYRGRTGFVPILSLKVGLSVMCSEKVQEKYRCRCT